MNLAECSHLLSGVGKIGNEYKGCCVEARDSVNIT